MPTSRPSRGRRPRRRGRFRYSTIISPNCAPRPRKIQANPQSPSKLLERAPSTIQLARNRRWLGTVDCKGNDRPGSDDLKTLQDIDVLSNTNTSGPGIHQSAPVGEHPADPDEPWQARKFHRRVGGLRQEPRPTLLDAIDTARGQAAGASDQIKRGAQKFRPKPRSPTATCRAAPELHWRRPSACRRRRSPTLPSPGAHEEALPPPSSGKVQSDGLSATAR